MGFRSTFTTESYNIVWPEWFREKYDKAIWFGADHTGPLHSKMEAKTYGHWADLDADILRAIPWDTFGPGSFVLVFLHECGGITRCQIERDGVRWSEPESWHETGGFTHSYCYGCSDVNNIEAPIITPITR